MSAHFRLRPRGLVAALNNSSPAAILNELSTAFADFRTRNDNTIRDIRASIDEINAAFAAHRIGGGAGDNPNVQRAQAALVDFMRTGRADAMAALLPQNRSMSSDSDPDGGYMVPEQIDSVIQNQLIELSPMRALASIVRTSTADYSKLINRRGATSGWVGERSDRPTTDTPMLGEIKPPMGELYAQPEITARLMDDSAFDLAAFLQENVSDEFSMQEAGAFVFGDGVEKPRGFLSLPTAPTADATRPFGTLQYKATGVAGDIFDGTHNGIDVLIDLVHSLRPSYRAGEGVGWQMNSTTASIIRKLKSLGDTANYLWQDSAIAGQPSMLLGYPVYENEYMNDVGVNTYPIAFGNWKRGYTIVDRSELRLLRDPYTKKGWIRFYFTKRVGGAPTDSNAIKLLKVAIN